MKLQTQAGPLAAAVMLATIGVRANKKTVPAALGALRITAADGVVSVGCFDRCLSIQANAAAVVIEPGVAALPADRFFALVSNFKPDVDIVITDGNITCGDSARYRLPTIPIEDLPAAPVMPETAGVPVTGDDVLTLLEPTAAADGEKTRFNLGGVFWHSVGDELFAAATDGKHLLQTRVTAGKLSEDRRRPA